MTREAPDSDRRGEGNGRDAQLLAVLQSRKLASAPESIRALQEWTESW